MIAQIVFTVVLITIMLVAFAQMQQIPLVGGVVICAALFGAYIVWMPDHATYLANLVGRSCRQSLRNSRYNHEICAACSDSGCGYSR
jgi:hypothetical protein